MKEPDSHYVRLKMHSALVCCKLFYCMITATTPLGLSSSTDCLVYIDSITRLSQLQQILQLATSTQNLLNFLKATAKYFKIKV